MNDSKDNKSVFIYSDLSERLRKLIQTKTGHVTFNNPADTEQSLKAFADASILMGNPPRDWFSKTQTNFRFWQLDSAGFDQYKGLNTTALVANMGDFFSLTCAETIVAGLLSFYRRMPELAVLKHQKKWVGKPLRYGMDLLSGKSVIILGAGTIAQRIRDLLSGFECRVTFVARRSPLASIHSREELIQSISGSQVVINTLPGAAGQYVTSEIFQAMADGTIYASVGRGTTTDESALVDALKSGKVAGAVLDVTEKEPLPADNPLWALPQVILTQHTGGGHKLEDEGKVEQFLSNLELFEHGKPVRNQVNLERGY